MERHTAAGGLRKGVNRREADWHVVLTSFEPPPKSIWEFRMRTGEHPPEDEKGNGDQSVSRQPIRRSNHPNMPLIRLREATPTKGLPRDIS